MKVTPNPKVIKLLDDIVKKDTTEINSAGQTKEYFLSLNPPKEDLPKDETLLESGFATIRRYDDPYLLACTKLLGASRCTNALLYPPNSIMHWHTNSDRVGKRIYYIYTLGESMFRYIDYDGVEKIDYDNVGWTAREFTVSATELLWHTIWTEQKRYAFGFNVEP